MKILSDNVKTNRLWYILICICAFGRVKPVLRAHLWDKEKSGLIRQVTL